MAYIKFSIQEPTCVQLPYWFIMDYMPKALGGYLKVYIYLLAQSTNAKNLHLETVAKELDMLYSELIQALNYWHEQNVLHFKELSDQEFELQFYKIQPPKKETPTLPEVPLAKTLISQSRPEYRTEEINLYIQNNSCVSQLFKISEQYLGRLLTATDQKILFSLYDWLHMPFDLIEFLIEYCASNNHTAIHYIEKVAITWVDEGIHSVEQAKQKLDLDKRYFKILKALGASKNTITLSEKKCINKWLNEYGLTLEIILEACKRTVMQTHKPSLNYVDSILSAWYNAKVKTLDDITLIDKAYESKKQLTTSSSFKNKLPPKATKFNDIYSHNWNFDELEKLESDYIDRKLNGGT